MKNCLMPESLPVKASAHWEAYLWIQSARLAAMVPANDGAWNPVGTAGIRQVYTSGKSDAKFAF